MQKLFSRNSVSSQSFFLLISISILYNLFSNYTFVQIYRCLTRRSRPRESCGLGISSENLEPDYSREELYLIVQLIVKY